LGTQEVELISGGVIRDADNSADIGMHENDADSSTDIWLLERVKSFV